MSVRLVTRISDEQYESFKAEMERRGVDEATMLRLALDYYWSNHDAGLWPDNDPKHGGARPLKNGGSQEIDN